MKEIDRSELKQMMDEQENLVVLDVMRPDPYKKFHIPGAVNAPVAFDDFEQKASEAVGDKSTPVVVYCQDRNCPDSEDAARRLDQAGFENVYDYKAGKDDWQQADEKLIAGPNPG